MKLHGLTLPPRIPLAELFKLRRGWTGMPASPGGDGALEEVAAFGGNPGALRMLRFVPRGLPPGAPLVVVLHGCTQTAGGFDAGTGWSTLAARHGFALLFPEQVAANNHNTCFNWFQPGDIARGGGEAASIRAMVEHTVRTLRIDPARVFVTGLSAGGAMASVLLATYPDVFAAGAVIAGLPYRCAVTVSEALAAMRHPAHRAPTAWGDLVRAASPAPRRKPIVSIWHGDADATVALANAHEHAAQWCDVHGLTESRDGVLDGVARRSWRDAGGTVRVELLTVPGLGHGTPIAPDQAGDRGVGCAMPFVLDAGVPSTWHIAKGWGLV